MYYYELQIIYIYVLHLSQGIMLYIARTLLSILGGLPNLLQRTFWYNCYFFFFFMISVIQQYSIIVWIWVRDAMAACYSGPEAHYVNDFSIVFQIQWKIDFSVTPL